MRRCRRCLLAAHAPALSARNRDVACTASAAVRSPARAARPNRRRWRRPIRSRSPLPPSTITRSPWETSRPRSTKDRRNGVNSLLVLGVRLDKAQEQFVPRHRDAQRDDHRRLGERLAVQHEGHNVLPGEVPLLEFAEFRRAGLNERAGHRRPRQADRPGNRLGGRRVVAARDPIQHAPQQQVIDGAIAMALRTTAVESRA